MNTSDPAHTSRHRGLAPIWRWITSFVSGVWLLILYIVSSLLVVYSLSAHQLISSIYSAGGDLSLYEIRDLHTQWSQKRGEDTKLQAELADTDALLEELAAKLGYQRYELQVANRERNRAETLLKAELDQEDFERFRENNFVLIGDFPGALREQMKNFRKLIDWQSEAHAEIDAIHSDQESLNLDREQIIARMNAAQEAVKTLIEAHGGAKLIGDLLNSYDFFLSESRTPSATIAEIETATAASIEDEDERTDTSGFAEAYSAARDATLSPLIKVLHYVAPVFRPSTLISLPPEMLTLIVVISMGALGGTIHLTQVYLRQRRSPDAEDRALGIWYFIFRPLLGCITAFTIFILTKAGVLVLSTSNPGDFGGSLNPYFVSFLGIISGYLAEDALRTIERVGTNWFKDPELPKPDRWAYGLTDQIERLGDGSEKAQAREKLAALLRVDKNTIERWEQEKAAVPHRYQTAIAAFFRTSIRDIFSDLRADQMSVEVD